MWYFPLNKRDFCIYYFLHKASILIHRHSTDQAASNRWTLKTAAFKIGLKFFGTAYWYRLPPASTGLRFHSRCSHLPCSTSWSMFYQRKKFYHGKLKMQATPSVKPVPPKSQSPHVQQGITWGKKQSLRFWESKRSFLDTAYATTIVTWHKLTGKSIGTRGYSGLTKAVLYFSFQGPCPWLSLLARLQIL